jgi:L-alanine-DL-glutamate epimerase-like enolase superfamily enzyme
MMMYAHLVATIPNRHMLKRTTTFNPFTTDLFKETPEVVNGYIDLPDKPGLGFELIDDFDKKFPYVPGYYGKPNPTIR